MKKQQPIEWKPRTLEKSQERGGVAFYLQEMLNTKLLNFSEIESLIIQANIDTYKYRIFLRYI